MAFGDGLRLYMLYFCLFILNLGIYSAIENKAYLLYYELILRLEGNFNILDINNSSYIT